MSSVRRLGPASIATPWTRAFSLAAVASAGLALGSCNSPTQVSVVITTDMPCDRIKTVSVTVGAKNEVDSKDPAGTSDKCAKIAGSDRSQIGEIILYPSGDRDGEVALKVVAGVDTKPDQCTKEFNYTGCIVARRALRYISHATLEVPVFLSGSCKDVGCTARPNETCVLGACVPAQIPNAEMCVDDPPEKEGMCEEGVLTSGDQPLPPPAPVECGRPSVITDSFDVKSTQWYENKADMNIPAVEMGGVLVITPPASAAELTKVERRTDHAVNLDRDAITVRVAEMLNTESGASAYLAAEFDQTKQMRIEQKQGKLSFLHTDGTGKLVGPSVTYDPTKHVWWEIRDTGVNIVMRTSADGKTWAIGDLFPKPAYAEHVYIVLGAATDKAETKPGAVKFDDLNQGRPPAAWCSVSTFSDTFDATTRSPIWEFKEDVLGHCSAEGDVDGVVFQNDGKAVNNCYLRSRSAFDITNNSIVTRIESVSEMMDPDAIFYLGVEDDNEGKIQVGIRTVGADLQSYYIWNPNGGIGQNPVATVSPPLSLRLREAKKTIYWETLMDGDKDWKVIYESPPDIATTAVHVTLGLQAYSPFATNTNPAIVKVSELTTGPAPAP